MKLFIALIPVVCILSYAPSTDVRAWRIPISQRNSGNGVPGLQNLLSTDIRPQQTTPNAQCYLDTRLLSVLGIDPARIGQGDNHALFQYDFDFALRYTKYREAYLENYIDIGVNYMDVGGNLGVRTNITFLNTETNISYPTFARATNFRKNTVTRDVIFFTVLNQPNLILVAPFTEMYLVLACNMIRQLPPKCVRVGVLHV